jgi:ATPase subunit of ABC transporter with duplicated ATPase domains
MLASWPGALVVVSHDGRFLDKMALTHRIAWTSDGWAAGDVLKNVVDK